MTVTQTGLGEFGANPPAVQIRRLFELAERYDCDLDMHLDFDLNPEGMTISEVIRCTRECGWQNRVTIGHVTKLSALPPELFEETARALAEAGVQVTALPSTDLFLNGLNRLGLLHNLLGVQDGNRR